MRSRSLCAATVGGFALTLLPASASAAVITEYSDGFATPIMLLATSATSMTPAPKVKTNDTTLLTRVANSFYVSQPFFTASRISVKEANLPANVYFSFTAGAAAGYELDLTSLSFNANRGGSSGPRTVDVRSSVDNFQTSLTGGLVTIGTERPASGGTTWTNVSIGLDGTQFQNLPSVTFRVYIFTPTPAQDIDFDDVKLEGTVSPIPEPAALGALGSSAMLLARRRASGTR